MIPTSRIPAALRTFLVGLLLVPGLLAASSPAQAVPSDVVISQVYGGGGSLFTNDFIELHNRGTAPVSVNGWSVQYSKIGVEEWKAALLTGSIPAGGYLLVQAGAGAGGGSPLPAPFQNGTSIVIDATGGKVALVNDSNLLFGVPPTDASHIVDLLGWGAVDYFEGQVAGATTANTAAFRLDSGCLDTDNNLNNFSVNTAPAPRTSVSPLFQCQFTLTYLAGLNGTITGITPQTVAHNGNGTQVTAVPNAGYHFVGWSDGVLTAARTDLNVIANITATASFEVNLYTLTYNAGENGTISGTTPQTVPHGGSGTLVTAVPDAGYHFVSWSDGVLTAARTDLNVTANITATASFAINLYTLTYNAGANGTISGTTPQTVPHGGSGTAVTAVPDAGYHFVSWSDGGLTATRTDGPVTANLTVTAEFAINLYTLTYNAGANGTISGTTPQTVPHGGSGTAVTAVPNVGYHFVKWSDDVATATRTDSPVIANLTVTASFEINQYTLTYNAGPGGTISGTTPQTVPHGGSGTAVTAVPNVGRHFVKWSDNVLTATRTDGPVTANLTVTAEFAINEYTLTYIAGVGGTISGPTPQTVPHGGSGTAVTAVPNVGYHFVKWSDDVATATRTDNPVTADLTVTAQFAEKKVVVSQIYGGGGESGATLTHDFVELFNQGEFAVDITHWTVQYAAATGTTWTTTELSGVIPPHSYFLVQQAAGAGGSTPLPVPVNATGTANLDAFSGKVALVSSTVALSGSCHTGDPIEDFVGYGSADCSESSPALSPTNTTAALRKFRGCIDTDNNSADFIAGTPDPRNSASPVNTCTFTLTVVVSPPGSGTVTASPNQVTFAAGALVQLTATPSLDPPANHFDHWSGVQGGSVNPLAFNMDSDKTVTAHFVSNGTAGQIVISQFFGGGGDLLTGLKNDYVELYNRGNATVNVSGWSIQFAAATSAVWNLTPLSGSIQPGKHLLVQCFAGGSGDVNLITPDVIGALDVGATAGKLALVSNTTVLTDACPSFGVAIKDFVGYGIASCSETSPAGATSLTEAGFRDNDGCEETNDNEADFSNGSPDPHNSATPAHFCDIWLDAGTRPAELALSMPMPNPSRGRFNFSLGLPVEGDVRVTISDVQGRRIASLVNGRLPAGRHNLSWTGTGDAGPVRSGLYYLALEHKGQRVVRRFVIVR